MEVENDCYCLHLMILISNVQITHVMAVKHQRIGVACVGFAATFFASREVIFERFSYGGILHRFEETYD